MVNKQPIIFVFIIFHLVASYLQIIFKVFGFSKMVQRYVFIYGALK